MKVIAKHDPARYGDIGIAATAPFNLDEESSGIIDMEEILGPGNFLFVDQNHYATTTELVEGGQMLKLFNPDTYAASQVLTLVETSSSTTLEGVSLYPNPASGNVTVKFTLPSSEKVTLTLVDLQGRTLKSVAEAVYSEGTNSVALETADLATGIYLVEVRTSKATTRVKLVVAK